MQQMDAIDCSVPPLYLPNLGERMKGKSYTFRAKPDRVALLQEMGVDVAMLANNQAGLNII